MTNRLPWNLQVIQDHLVFKGKEHPGLRTFYIKEGSLFGIHSIKNVYLHGILRSKAYPDYEYHFYVNDDGFLYHESGKRFDCNKIEETTSMHANYIVRVITYEFSAVLDVDLPDRSELEKPTIETAL